jgi:hypothetical protein
LEYGTGRAPTGRLWLFVLTLLQGVPEDPHA